MLDLETKEMVSGNLKPPSCFKSVSINIYKAERWKSKSSKVQKVLKSSEVQKEHLPQDSNVSRLRHFDYHHVTGLFEQNGANEIGEPETHR